MAENISARSSWYAPLRDSCSGVQSFMRRYLSRSLPRLNYGSPMVDELPGHQVDGDDADEQNAFEEESADEGKRQPRDNGAGGFDHVDRKSTRLNSSHLG